MIRARACSGGCSNAPSAATTTAALPGGGGGRDRCWQAAGDSNDLKTSSVAKD
jgi:hypothetical protein